MKKYKLLLISIIATIGMLVNTPSYGQDRKAKNLDQETQVQHYTNAVDSYLRGLNEKDLEGILSLYAESASVEDPVGSEVIKGKNALRKFYGGAVKLDLTLIRTGPVRIAGREVAFPFQLLMEVNGVLMKSDIIDVFLFDEKGKIISMRAFWGPSNRQPVKE